MSNSKRIAIQDLNEDVILTLVQWFEALELLSWGMTCKRFSQTINSKGLWITVAQRLEGASIRVPFSYGDTVDSSSIRTLQVATSRACRLRRNLSSSRPRLYRSIQIPISRNPFKRQFIPEEARDCVHIFDGRWILYRLPQSLCVRHVDATKQKEIFRIPVMDYTGWAFEVTQVDRNVALVSNRHDVNEVWGLMEITFGDDIRTKPKVRAIDLGAPFRSWLAGSSLTVGTKNGITIARDVYSGQQSTLDQEYSVQREYLSSNGLLFNLHFQPGGRLELAAQRINDKTNKNLLASLTSVLNIDLKKAYQNYPQDTFFVKESIRAVSDELLTIWHRVHMKLEGEIYYALFIIDIPYIRTEGEEDAKPVIWDQWSCRASYVANGQQFVGRYGESMLLSRQVDEQAALTLYARFRLPTHERNSRMGNRGVILPAPNGAIPGDDVHAVRIAWDDARGIAAVMLENGMLWVLHYA